MIEVARSTKFVAGLPNSRRRRRRRSRPAHVARRVPRHQGRGEARARQGHARRAAHRAAGRGQRRHRRCASCLRRRRASCRSPTSIEGQGAEAGRPRPAGRSYRPTRSWRSKPTCSAHARSARSSTSRRSPQLKVPVVAGGANNQLATPRRRRAPARSAGSFMRPIT